VGKNLDVMTSLIASWKKRDVDAFLSHLTDDIEYHWHVGSKPVQGKEKMRKFLANYGAAFEQRQWQVKHSAENGDLLMVEGYEELYDPVHDRVIPQPFMQVAELRDGKIAKLRDYYEPANLKPPVAAEQT
jgi:limonene-1,2-epoxide hydrolase